MALIKCPECKKKISDQCENCLVCGYPIKKHLQDNNDGTLNAAPKVTRAKKSVLNKAWFWITMVLMCTALSLGVLFLLNQETKPLFDETGNPVFVELTDEVYTNANNYLGYHINIKGKVFQVMGDTGTAKGIQIWLDPDTSEQNLMIYYTSDVEISKGDYIACTGYIDSVTAYDNVYGATLYAPLVYSFDLRKSSYIEVVSPTIDEIQLENIGKKNLGYSVAINKVEFAENETRIYVTVTNDGKAALYFGDVVAVQGGKQYTSTENYDADYEKIPYEIAKGAVCSGIVVMPAMNLVDFELVFDLHSADVYENLGEYAFVIGKAFSGVKEPEKPFETFTTKDLKQEKYGYSIEIDKVEFYKKDTRIYITVTNNGPANLNIDVYDSVIVQNNKQYSVHEDYSEETEKLPTKIHKGSKISGVIVFPAMNAMSFDFTINIYSDDFEDKLGEITALIGKTGSNRKMPWPSDPSAVGQYHCYYGESEYYLYFFEDGTLYQLGLHDTYDFETGEYYIVSSELYGVWTQFRDTITYSVWEADGFEWNNPFYGTVYTDGIEFLSDFYKRQ